MNSQNSILKVKNSVISRSMANITNKINQERFLKETNDENFMDIIFKNKGDNKLD